jgi:hypothetical protein
MRNTINHLKQERSITPKVYFVKAGSTDDALFENLLIEEQNKAGMSFSQFVEVLHNEVSKTLQ